MPAFIAPIEHTRAAFLKPLDGLRFGNFEGIVHLPPVPVSEKTVTQSFSTLNNQQIYKTVCEWYETWRPWQQRVLLCGIVDRCSMRQVDMLATTLEPIRHRDYVVAVKHHYPTTPLKTVQDKQGRKKKKKKVKKKVALKTKQDHSRALNTDGNLHGAVTPESIIDPSQVLSSVDQQTLHDRLTKGDTYRKKQLSVIQQEKTKEFTNIDNEYVDIESYADSLAKRIIGESIPQTISVFDPSELYAQDLASSIMQQAMDQVVGFMENREKSIQMKTAKTRLPEPKDDTVGMKVNPQTDNVKHHDHPARKDVDDKSSLVDMAGPPTHRTEVTEYETETTVTLKPEKKIDLSVLNKYRKFKPPKEGDKTNRFYKMPGRPKSMVKILIPDSKGETGNQEESSIEKPPSAKSRFSAITHSTLSNLRYHLFGARSLKTPDYFRKDGAASLEGGMQHLRQGVVRRPHGMQSLPLPISKMYKSVKWWTDSPGDCKVLMQAQKQELGLYFKEQLQQVWDWMELWEDYEKIALLKELLKLCGPEDLNFFCGHLQQKLRDARDINRMSDKLLLYIFSFIPADEISKVKRVCRRWRYLCATDDLWKVKCHELGLAEGIKNLEKMIVKAKGYKMVIDWKMAYDELKKITYNVKLGMLKKKPKPILKGRAVEFKEQLEMLQQRVIHEKEKQRAASRGTPVIVELEVHRGTVSAIRRQERKGDDDAQSVISEDLREFDEEYKLQWEMKPERKPGQMSVEPIRAVSTEGGVEILTKSEDRFDRIKRMQAGYTPSAGPSILRRRKEKQMADDAAGDDAAYDIRPDLVPADDILGKAKPHMSLQWKKEEKASPRDSDEEEEEYQPRKRQPIFVGEVRGVLRARKLQGHMSGITCVQFDHRRLISAGLDRVIRMWDIRSGRSLHKFFGHKGGIRCLKFLANELATGSWDTTIMIWDLRNLSRKYILTDHSDSVTCLAMNQDFLVSGSVDCTVRVWRRSSYLCCNVLKGHTQAVTSVAFDGKHVVSASKDTTLRMSNIISGDCVRTFHCGEDPIASVCMKGSLIMSGDTSGRIFFWNKLSGECEAAIQAHQESVNKIMYREGRFYTASGDGTIREWDLVTMTSVRLLQGHKGPVKDLQVTGDRMVSCSEDGSIRIWDLFDPRKKTTEEEQIKQLHQECPTL